MRNTQRLFIKQTSKSKSQSNYDIPPIWNTYYEDDSKGYSFGVYSYIEAADPNEILLYHPRHSDHCSALATNAFVIHERQYGSAWAGSPADFPVKDDFQQRTKDKMWELVKKTSSCGSFTAARQKMGLNKKSFIQLLGKFKKIKSGPITLSQKAEIDVLSTGYQNGVWSVHNSHCVDRLYGIFHSFRQVLVPFKQTFYQSTHQGAYDQRIHWW